MRRASPILKLGRSYQIAVSHAGGLIAGIGGNSLVSVWDVHNRSKIARMRDIKNPQGVALSHDGQHLAVKGLTGTIGVYNLTAQHLVGTVQPTPRKGQSQSSHPTTATLWMQTGTGSSV